MPAQARRISVPVRIGNVTVGGSHPIVVQSMTNTDTADVGATVKQVESLALAGSELVRVTVNTHEAARAVPERFFRRVLGPAARGLDLEALRTLQLPKEFSLLSSPFGGSRIAGSNAFAVSATSFSK